jgi:hypothetical protein
MTISRNGAIAPNRNFFQIACVKPSARHNTERTSDSPYRSEATSNSRYDCFDWQLLPVWTCPMSYAIHNDFIRVANQHLACKDLG